MTILLLVMLGLYAVAVPSSGVPIVIAVLIGMGLGYHYAVRKSGTGMVKTGVKRIITGNF